MKRNEPAFHFKPHTDGTHIWRATASPHIERCGRGCCQATRYYRNGAWSEPYTEQPKPIGTQAAQQPDLWANG